MTLSRVFSLLLLCAAAQAQIVGNVAPFVWGNRVGASQPGAVTVSLDQSVWISYTNGANAASGESTVVRYDTEGRVLKKYQIAGSVDGLEENPFNHSIWALQNRTGNPALTVIWQRSGIGPNSPNAFAVESPTRGYRDVAFVGDQVLLSYANPAGSTDPTMQAVVAPGAPIQVADVVLADATGINVLTGETGQPTRQTDPGSIRPTPWGGVMMASRADGQLIFLRDAHQHGQALGFLNVVDGQGKQVSGLNDAFFALPGQSLFFLTNATRNVTWVVYIFGIPAGQVFALVDSMNALVTIDLRTGVATPVLGNLGGFERMAALRIGGEFR